jgi:hypothetical protein
MTLNRPLSVQSGYYAAKSRKRVFHKGNCPRNAKWHQNMAMRDHAKFVLLAISVGVLCCPIVSNAQDAPPTVTQEPGIHAHKPRRPSRHTLSKDDRSSVVAVALHSKKTRHTGRDCSHLVHSIYQSAGFPYPYADSEDLYDGAKGFQRVAHPEAADLIVWHGHVGIVVRPTQHKFFSFLSTGPGIDDYRSPYWKSRGQPRFYRYVKNDS